MKDKETITISLEEYRELLVIKGRYLEKQEFSINTPKYPTLNPQPYVYPFTTGTPIPATGYTVS